MSKIISINAKNVPQDLINTLDTLIEGIASGEVEGLALVWSHKTEGLRTLINTQKKVAELSLGTSLVQKQLLDAALTVTSIKE